MISRCPNDKNIVSALFFPIYSRPAHIPYNSLYVGVIPTFSSYPVVYIEYSRNG